MLPAHMFWLFVDGELLLSLSTVLVRCSFRQHAVCTETERAAVGMVLFAAARQVRGKDSRAPSAGDGMGWGVCVCVRGGGGVLRGSLWHVAMSATTKWHCPLRESTRIAG
jgi:hypothetical protein